MPRALRTRPAAPDDERRRDVIRRPRSNRPVGRHGLSRVVLIAVTLCAIPAAAHAQDTETTLVGTELPQGFDRGRNVSVLEQPRPDYDPLGILIGSFKLFPRVELSAGATSNVYLADNDPVSAAILSAAPSFQLNSDWSVHQLRLNGGAQIDRYVGQSRRNDAVWNLGALGRLDVGSSSNVTGEVQLARQVETPFSGEVSSNLAVLSHYLRNYESVRAEYVAGQGRAILSVDHTGFSFSDIKPRSGGTIDQSIRDRDIDRIIGQIEYAFTPSVSVYGQAALALTRYDDPLAPGVPNRDSNGYRVIGGVNFDISGLARGTIGVGYIRRDYRPSIYKDVGGFSVEARIEYFPSELTTFTLAARRVIEDSNLSNNDAFFDNRASLRVDHALLDNLILNAIGEIAVQNYIDRPTRVDVYRVGVGGRYLATRRYGLDVGVSYTTRSDHRPDFAGDKFNEIRGQVGVYLQL